jgi:hypothetical protein
MPQNSLAMIVSALIDILLSPLHLLVWFHKKPKSPREDELARASYGAVMVVVGIFVVPRFAEGWWWVLPPVLVAWGFHWVMVGASRSGGPRDMRLLVLAVVKIGVGVFAYTWLNQLHGLYRLALIAFIGWCIVTGLTKFALLLRPPSNVHPGNLTPYGNSSFGDGSGFA